MLKIAMIPIDNRPVCYCMPEQINDFCPNTEFYIPPRELLGGLTTYADSNKILDWLENLREVDVLIVALDTIAYGGLVASRRSEDTYEQICTRLERLKNLLLEKKIKAYACTSIMRISNNNINEEEKEYWNKWGKKIFDYSYNLHKAQKAQSYDSNAKFSCIGNVIPDSILEDYFSTRKRNFDINKLYLNWQTEGVLDYLVFSKDDCAQYGVNVAEAEEIETLISRDKLNAIVKTGADEIPLSLMARAFSDLSNKHVKIYPEFLRPQETDLISKYEDVSILNSVKGQIDLCGATVATNKKDADIILIVNNFKNEQGELVMNVSTELFSGELKLPQQPYIIADVAFANGADNNFVDALFSNNLDRKNFCGFAAWNTSANTLGSAICAGIFKFVTGEKCDITKFKHQQFVRFADDWAYQANIRAKLKQLSTLPEVEKAQSAMLPYFQKLEKVLNLPEKYSDRFVCSFPWGRFFEIEIGE